ncbi:MAG: hypothetical protein EXR63_02820 [Dehalococcoidia bacterium]|nr:hypothetical protein [Dehalococcoidia bacterium]
MAKIHVNVIVLAGSAAAFGASWASISTAESHTAADAAAEAQATTAVEAAAPPVVAAPIPLDASQLSALPSLSSRLGAAPPIQLPPLAPLGVGSAVALDGRGNPVANAPALVAAPPAPGPVVASPAQVAPAPVVAAPAQAAPAPAPAPAVAKKTKAS